VKTGWAHAMSSSRNQAERSSAPASSTHTSLGRMISVASRMRGAKGPFWLMKQRMDMTTGPLKPFPICTSRTSTLSAPPEVTSTTPSRLKHLTSGNPAASAMAVISLTASCASTPSDAATRSTKRMSPSAVTHTSCPPITNPMPHAAARKRL
jgi:hypothetical protein